MEGWIKLHRQLLDSDLWKSEPFTRGQAWVDLLLLANHQESFFYKRGVKIIVKRGQLARSEVELSDRWKWSRTKVRKFLNDLKKEQQIEQQKTNVTQVVSIVNYELYQKKEQQTGQQKNSKRTAKEQQKNTYKNDKNVNNDKNKVEDVYIDINILKDNYLKNERLVKVFCESQKIENQQLIKSLNEFNIELSNKNQFLKTDDDYTSHFKNWYRKKPQINLELKTEHIKSWK
ncbi:MAG TPA: hypothetical protein VIO43_12245 [Lutibacter sp.]